MNLSNLVRAAIFSAVAIGLGFMFMLVPNVEFISITVFLSGLTLGFSWGAAVGASSMLIYSSFNPLGSGLIYFTLLIGQILARMAWYTGARLFTILLAAAPNMPMTTMARI